MAETRPPDPRRVLLETYQKRIQQFGVGPIPIPYHCVPKTRGDRLAHALMLCLDLQCHLEEWRPGKVERKLSFIQGILWCEGLYTQAMIRAHNRGL